MEIKLEFSTADVTEDKTQRVGKAQIALDVQVLKDSNFYAPMDEGTLMRSGVIASGGGQVVWDMPYAKMQYYEKPNKSQDRNPNARMKWFQAAKAAKVKAWERLVNAEYNG